MSDFSVKALAKIPGAKVKSNEDNVYYWKRFEKELGVEEVQKALKKFWTVKNFFCDIIYIDISEHLPVPKEEAGFFHWRFDQVKCYMSGEQK